MKRFVLLLAVLVAFLSTYALTSAEEERIRIRDWDFTWTVEESKDAYFTITKTDESLYCYLSSGHSAGLRCSPEDAAAIGKVIRDAGDAIKVIKGDQEQSTKKEIGKYQVEFSYDPERGGSVFISSKELAFGNLGNNTYLNTREAEELGDAMVNAVTYAKAVDERVNP